MGQRVLMWSLKNMINTCSPELLSCSEPWILPRILSRSFHNLCPLTYAAMTLALFCIGRCLGSPPWFDQSRMRGERPETWGMSRYKGNHFDANKACDPCAASGLQQFPGVFVSNPFWFQRAFKVAFLPLPAVSPSPGLPPSTHPLSPSRPRLLQSAQRAHALCQEYSPCTAPQTAPISWNANFDPFKKPPSTL